MTNFVFPSGNVNGPPNPTRSSMLLCADGTLQTSPVGSAPISSILSLLSKSDLTNSGALTNLIGYNGSTTISPIGNAPTTSTALNITGTTNQANQREFLVSIGLTNSTGVGQDKVGLYTGMVNTASGGSGWSFYSVMGINSGYGGVGATAGTKTVYGYELDLNNANRDVSQDFSNPYIGMALTGASVYTCTAGIEFSGAGNAPSSGTNSQWERGIVFSPGWTINDVAIEDRSNSNCVLRALNGANGSGATNRVTGIDFSQADFTSAAIALKKGSPSGIILWTNNTTTVSDYVDASGNRFVGNGATSTFMNGSFVLPVTDNVTTLGSSSNRWQTVYAVNGNVQTSDVSLKTDVSELPSTLNLIKDINPIRFKWKDGGNNEKGKRTHWGFSAEEIKNTMLKYDVGDFGGYVFTDDGKHSLRPDQLIPILWQGMKELMEKVDSLSERLGGS